MKVSQLVLGEQYESKDGGEIREIISFVSDGTLRYVIVPIVSDAKEARKLRNMPTRRHESSQRDFAKWAARKAGTSTHQSTTGNKLLTTMQGPKG